MGRVENNVELGGDVCEIRGVKVCDDDFYSRARFEEFCSRKVADKGGDVITFEEEDVVEELSSNESCGAYCSIRRNGNYR